MTGDRKILVSFRALEYIGRQLETIANEAMHLKPGPTADHITECAGEALVALRTARTAE